MTPRLPRDIRPTDVFIRWAFGDEEPPGLVADGMNAAWLGRASRPGELWITGMGDEPERVAALVERLDAEHHVDGVTVSETAFAHLPSSLRSPDPGHWCYWVLDPGAAVVTETVAVSLDADDPRIDPLLASSDSAYTFAGDPRIVRWAGVVEDEALLAVAGQVTAPTGAAQLVSVCTHPSVRGRGLGREACMAIIRDAVADGAPMLVLEMYVANDAGRRLYSGLGFTEVGRFMSGLLAHALPA